MYQLAKTIFLEQIKVDGDKLQNSTIRLRAVQKASKPISPAEASIVNHFDLVSVSSWIEKTLQDNCTSRFGQGLPFKNIFPSKLYGKRQTLRPINATPS